MFGNPFGSVALLIKHLWNLHAGLGMDVWSNVCMCVLCVLCVCVVCVCCVSGCEITLFLSDFSLRLVMSTVRLKAWSVEGCEEQPR